MLINNIRNDAVISDFICQECKENDIQAAIDLAINSDDIVIVKIDDFYNARVRRPDCSPDCLIIQRCRDRTFNIYIVELKNINSPKKFTVENIVEKFNTCLGDFMSVRFANYFHSGDIDIQNISLLFISDPYHFKKNPRKQDYMRGHKIDALLSQRIPKYFSKHLYIEYKVPNPTIKKCS